MSDEAEAPAGPGEDADKSGRAARRYQARRAALAALAVAVLASVIVVEHHTLAGSRHVLARLNWGWFLLAVAADIISWVSFGLSRRELPRVGGRPPRFRLVMAITYAANALPVSVPFAGAERALVFSCRQFRRPGVDAATTGWMLAVPAIFAISALALLLVTGALAGSGSLATAAGFLGAFVFIVPGVAVLLALGFRSVRTLLHQIIAGLVSLSRSVSGVPARGVDGLDRFLDRVASLRLPWPPYAGIFALAGLNGAADCAPQAAAPVRVSAPRSGRASVRTPSGPGQAVTVADLQADPHPVLARLRAAAPVCWVPVLDAWLVTGYQAAVDVLRDARAFTVDDPRFSTATVVGPSMLSLDGAQHARHRAPFTRPFRAEQIHARFESFIRAEASRLVTAIAPAGRAELRRAVAGPLAAAVMAEALGLGQSDPATVLGWYDGIVAAVQAQAAAGSRTPGEQPAGDAAAAGSAAFAALAARLAQVIAAGAASSLLAEAAGPLTEGEAISNAAVLLFGGIETTEGMIANAVLHLLSAPAELEAARADHSLIPGAVEESLRLEPAAAVVDRYATRDIRLGQARIRAGDQVTVSITGANRDPAVFAHPGTFDIRRPDPARHLTFAHGPHFCLGAHLARLEAQIAVEAILAQLPGLDLDPRSASTPTGLVFRKPASLSVCWNAP